MRVRYFLKRLQNNVLTLIFLVSNLKHTSFMFILTLCTLNEEISQNLIFASI